MRKISIIKYQRFQLNINNMEDSPNTIQDPKPFEKVSSKKDLSQEVEPSEAVNINLNLAENRKTEVVVEASKFPDNLPPSTRRALQFFRVTTIGIYCFVYSLYMVFANPIKPYIKTLNQALGIDAQLSSFVFSLPSLLSLVAGVPANIFLTKFGQKACVLFYLLLIAAGFGFRVLIPEDFNYYIIGSVLVGIALPFGNNICLVVCTEWFDTKHVSELNL